VCDTLNGNKQTFIVLITTKKKKKINNKNKNQRENNLEFKEVALDKAQDEAGFPGAHVAEQNLIMRSQVTIFFFSFKLIKMKNWNPKDQRENWTDQLRIEIVMPDRGHGLELRTDRNPEKFPTKGVLHRALEEEAFETKLTRLDQSNSVYEIQEKAKSVLVLVLLLALVTVVFVSLTR
jgi:hypothetical protein